VSLIKANASLIYFSSLSFFIIFAADFLIALEKAEFTKSPSSSSSIKLLPSNSH